MSSADSERKIAFDERARQYLLHTRGALLAILLFGGCHAQPSPTNQEPAIGVAITGIDHLADHLSVQEFSVNGYSAAQAGRGGSSVCCAMLPERWRDGLQVNVEWVEQNWRDCSYRKRHRDVPVERYDKVGRLRVHFLENDSIRVIAANVGPRNSNYPGPRDEPPSKAPWHEYSNDMHCNRHWAEDTTP